MKTQPGRFVDEAIGNLSSNLTPFLQDGQVPALTYFYNTYEYGSMMAGQTATASSYFKIRHS